MTWFAHRIINCCLFLSGFSISRVADVERNRMLSTNLFGIAYECQFVIARLELFNSWEIWHRTRSNWESWRSILINNTLSRETRHENIKCRWRLQLVIAHNLHDCLSVSVPIYSKVASPNDVSEKCWHLDSTLYPLLPSSQSTITAPPPYLPLPNPSSPRPIITDGRHLLMTPKVKCYFKIQIFFQYNPSQTYMCTMVNVHSAEKALNQRAMFANIQIIISGFVCLLCTMHLNCQSYAMQQREDFLENRFSSGVGSGRGFA